MYYSQNIRNQIDYETKLPVVYGIDSQSPYVFGQDRLGLEDGFRVEGDGLPPIKFPFITADGIQIDDKTIPIKPMDIYFNKSQVQVELPETRPVTTDYVHYNLPFQVNSDGSPRYDTTPSQTETRQQMMANLERIKSLFNTPMDEIGRKQYDDFMKNLMISDPQLYGTLQGQDNIASLTNLKSELNSMNENIQLQSFINTFGKADMMESVNDFMTESVSFITQFSDPTFLKDPDNVDILNRLLKEAELLLAQPKLDPRLKSQIENVKSIMELNSSMGKEVEMIASALGMSSGDSQAFGEALMTVYRNAIAGTVDKTLEKNVMDELQNFIDALDPKTDKDAIDEIQSLMEILTTASVPSFVSPPKTKKISSKGKGSASTSVSSASTTSSIAGASITPEKLLGHMVNFVKDNVNKSFRDAKAFIKDIEDSKVTSEEEVIDVIMKATPDPRYLKGLDENTFKLNILKGLKSLGYTSSSTALQDAIDTLSSGVTYSPGTPMVTIKPKKSSPPKKKKITSSLPL